MCFSEEKELMLEKIKELVKDYNKFTRRVCPSQYRITGQHLQALRVMSQEIENLNEISQRK